MLTCKRCGNSTIDDEGRCVCGTSNMRRFVAYRRFRLLVSFRVALERGGCWWVPLTMLAELTAQHEPKSHGRASPAGEGETRQACSA